MPHKLSKSDLMTLAEAILPICLYILPWTSSPIPSLLRTTVTISPPRWRAAGRNLKLSLQTCTMGCVSAPHQPHSPPASLVSLCPQVMPTWLILPIQTSEIALVNHSQHRTRVFLRGETTVVFPPEDVLFVSLLNKNYWF